MLVYRVEKEGKGPYHSSENMRLRENPTNKEFLSSMYDAHNEDNKHPSPWTENITMSGIDLCGFESLYSLRQWFLNFKQGLSVLGFKLAIYRVDRENVQFGRYQLVFNSGVKIMECPLV